MKEALRQKQKPPKSNYKPIERNAPTLKITLKYPKKIIGDPSKEEDKPKKE